MVTGTVAQNVSLLAMRKRKKISPNLDSLFPVIYNKYDTDLSGSEKTKSNGT